MLRMGNDIKKAVVCRRGENKVNSSKWEGEFPLCGNEELGRLGQPLAVRKVLEWQNQVAAQLNIFLFTIINI